MSRIDELIQQLCPDGVERKTLDDVGSVVRGKRFVKDDMIDAGVPCIHYGEIYTKYGVAATESISFVSEERARTLRFAQPGDVIMATAGETVEDIGKSVAWLGSEPIAIHDACYAFSSSMDPAFVSYFFASRLFRDQIRRHISSSKISSISTQNVAKVLIPVPPLEVQREIVRVLDQFTQLEAELEAELEARRRQYAYFRSSLTRVSDNVPLVSLGDIADFRYGYTDKAAESGTHRFIRITDITQYGKLSADGAKYVTPGHAANEHVVRPGDLLMARTGATFGKTVLVDSSEPSVYASFLIRIRFRDETLLPAYYWHFAQSAAFWDQANALVSTGGQPQFNANVLKLVRVPLPSLPEQERVVESLDKFDALANGLNFGLPAELAARRKQYEHYRDRLLTFKELAG